jgi:DNA-binding response OmpR family regulator
MTQLNKTTHIPTILVVDDDLTTLMLIEAMLKKQGYKVLTAKGGQSACSIIQDNYNVIDAIVLDRLMPDMQGLEVVSWINKQAYAVNIPVVMQTVADQPSQIKEGIDSGVFYYLTKPIQEQVLKSVVTAAIRESHHRRTLKKEMNQHHASFYFIDNCHYTISKLEEAENLACFLAHCFPDPEKVLPGLAELLINAVEHGNLEISYEEKTKLIDDDSWHEEVIKRQELPQYENRKIAVFYVRSDDAHTVKIVDGGKGFAWKKFMTFDASRASDNHGRGIAQINMLSFDSIKYNDAGNEVTAIVNRNNNEKNIDW